MTAPEPVWEWGVRWRYSAGDEGYVASGYTETGAFKTLRSAGDPKTHRPFAAEVVRRPVAGWLPVPLQPGTEK